MSILLINKKFDELSLKEKALNDYYDPVNRKGKQHINIQDLRDDYKEDLENYGFSKYQLKKDIERNQVKQSTIDENNTYQMSQIQIQPPNYSSSQSYQRPQTAAPHKSSAQFKRPTTAPFRNDDLVINEPDEDQLAYKQQNLERQQNKESKFWRNTKKFDTANQMQVRNHSALQKIMIEQNQDRPPNMQDEEQYNKQLIEHRINIGKLGQLSDHQIFKKKKQFYQERKQSPSDKDRFNSYIGFQDHLQYVRDNSVVLESTKKRIVLPQQQPQIIKPQVMTQPTYQSAVIKQTNPIAASFLSSQLDHLFDVQAKRPSTATLNRPASVRTIENINRISKRNDSDYSQYHSLVVPTIIASQPTLKQNQLIEAEYKNAQPMKVTPYQKIEFQQIPETSQTQARLNPVTSQFAMSLNYGEDNLASVLQLISSKSPSQSPYGVYKTGKQGLRSSSALKRPALQIPQSAQSVSSQSKLYGEQQNLRFIKKVRGMTNNILIKGTKFQQEQ